MSLDSIQDLYIEHIQDLYSAEQQIIEALPKMVDRATSQQLKDGFTQHLAQTREHARRLEAIGKRGGQDVDGKTCKGMQGVIKEGAEVLKEDGDPNVIDAALISAAQRVEHYEMAGYGCARAYAQALGLDDDAEALQQTLDEEGETDERLTKLAESIINPRAAGAESSSSRQNSTRSRSTGRDADNEARM